MHVAKHMEEIALAVLPRDAEFEDDHASLSSDQSQHEIQTVPADQGNVPLTQDQKLDTAPTKSEMIGETWKGNKRLSLADFHFLSTIGKGNFGKVLLAESKTSKSLYAIKILKKEFIIENDEIEGMKAEKRTLLLAAKESHPFIVRLHATFQTETRAYFVMEYIQGGDLMLHIQRGTARFR